MISASRPRPRSPALSKQLPEEAELIGYDNSPAMIERAKQKLREQGMEGRIDLRCADLNEAVDRCPSTAPASC